MDERAHLYRKFIEKLSPLGYALCFAKYGDFYKAQAVLEKALIVGFPKWEYFRKLSSSFKRGGARLMEHLLETDAPDIPLNEKGSSSESSFSHSTKLKALEKASQLIRTFPAREQAALVLLYVEEIPRDRIADWLEFQIDSLQALQESVEKQVKKWGTGPDGSEDPTEFFRRSLRQYRLSPGFCQTVSSQIRTGEKAPLAFPWVLGITLVLVFLVGLIGDVSGPGRRLYGGNERTLFLGVFASLMGGGNIILSIVIIMSAFLVRRFFLHHAPRGLLSRRQRHLLPPSLQVVVIMGVLFFIFYMITILNPRVLLNEIMAARVIFVGYLGWFMGSIIIVMSSLYQIFLHAFNRLMGAGPKGPER